MHTYIHVFTSGGGLLVMRVGEEVGMVGGFAQLSQQTAQPLHIARRVQPRGRDRSTYIHTYIHTHMHTYTHAYT